MQLGPMSVTPDDPRRSDQLRLRGGPRLSASEKPAATTSATGIPRSPHCSITAFTWAAPSVTSARSGAVRQVRDAREGGQTAHGAATTVHGIDGAGEAAVDEVAEEGAAPFERVVRGADDRDGARREQRGQVGGRGDGRRARDAERRPARRDRGSPARRRPPGVASSTMRGFTSISVTAGWSAAMRASARMAPASAARSTGGRPRKSSSSALALMPCKHALDVPVVQRRHAERDVLVGLGEDSSDAEDDDRTEVEHRASCRS